MRKNPYVVAYAMAAKRTLHKPAALVINALFYSALIIVFAALWRAAMDSSGGSVAGYDLQGIVCYLAGTEAAVVATRQRLIEEFGDDIVSKAVEAEMLRPVSMFGLRLANELGGSSVRSVVVLAAGLLGTSLLVGGPPNAFAACLGAVAVFLGMACNVVAQHLFAGVAFWLLEARTGWFLYQKVVFLIGGMLLPFQMIPYVLAKAAWILPFWTMAYAPGRLMSGHFEPFLLLGQFVWLAALVVAGKFVYAQGERRLQLTGG